jgi:hypothetical protein
MYKQYKNLNNKVIYNAIIRTEDGATIPFDPSNTDYANFKKDLAEGAELQDPDGKVIDGLAYLATLDKEEQ